MRVQRQAPVVNHLIAALPPKQTQEFLRNCEPVDLVFGAYLCEAEQPLAQVYFPLTGFISLVAKVQGHPSLEMGLIGNEGMLGATLILGVRQAHLGAVVQGAGTALRMNVPEFLQQLRRCAALRESIGRYLYVLMAQLSQTAVCIRFHDVEQRLARWLLMTHDRAHADHFHLTHQFLAGMLGVRRSGISVAAAALQKRKLIRYARGEIKVLNRRGLEAVACECYAAVNEDYSRVMSPATA